MCTPPYISSSRKADTQSRSDRTVTRPGLGHPPSVVLLPSHDPGIDQTPSQVVDRRRRTPLLSRTHYEYSNQRPWTVVLISPSTPARTSVLGGEDRVESHDPQPKGTDMPRQLATISLITLGAILAFFVAPYLGMHLAANR